MITILILIAIWLIPSSILLILDYNTAPYGVTLRELIKGEWKRPTETKNRFKVEYGIMSKVGWIPIFNLIAVFIILFSTLFWKLLYKLGNIKIK